MRVETIAAIVIMALVVAGVFATAAIAPPFGPWADPVVQETLVDASWQKRWAIQSGRFEIRSEKFITSGDKESRILLRQAMSGPVAVEFTATVLPGARTCDFTVEWYPEVTFAEDGTIASLDTPYQLQFGAYDNSFSCILDPQGNMIAYSDFTLEVNRPYQVRAELGGNDFRMFADGKEILQASNHYPLPEGRLALRFFYPGKAVSGITVWNQPALDGDTPLNRAISLTRKRRYAEAGRAYLEADQTASESQRGTIRYCAARSFELAEDPTAAAEAWNGVRETDHHTLAVLHDLTQAYLADDHQRVVRDFPAAYLACPGQFREQYALTWSRWVNFLRVRWLPLSVYEEYLNSYLACLTDNPLADRAAAELLLLLKRNPDVLERFPRQAPTCSRALIEMGRAREAFDRFGMFPLVNYTILLELGRFNDALLQGPVWATPFILNAMGKHQEVLDQFPHLRIPSAIALEGLARFQDAIDRYPELRPIHIDCLARLGRFDEALALAEDDLERANVLLRMGKAAEALAYCQRDFILQQTGRDLLGLQACMRGAWDEAKTWFTPNTPYFSGWSGYGFRRYILQAFLLGLAGDANGRQERLREAATLDSAWQGNLPRWAAVLTGDTPIDTAKESPRGEEGLLVVAMALEEAGNQHEALETYRIFAERSTRADPILQHFVTWRIAVLGSLVLPAPPRP